MTNPAWQVLYGKIIGGRDRRRRDRVPIRPSSPASTSIPAVVGTSVGTSMINTGDRLRVDGNVGIVEIL